MVAVDVAGDVEGEMGGPDEHPVGVDGLQLSARLHRQQAQPASKYRHAAELRLAPVPVVGLADVFDEDLEAFALRKKQLLREFEQAVRELFALGEELVKREFELMKRLLLPDIQQLGDCHGPPLLSEHFHSVEE